VAIAWSRRRPPLPRELHAMRFFDHAMRGATCLLKVPGPGRRGCSLRRIYDISLVLNCPLFVLAGELVRTPRPGSARGASDGLGTRVQPRLATRLLKVPAPTELFWPVRLALVTARFKRSITTNFMIGQRLQLEMGPAGIRTRAFEGVVVRGHQRAELAGSETPWEVGILN